MARLPVTDSSRTTVTEISDDNRDAQEDKGGDDEVDQSHLVEGIDAASGMKFDNDALPTEGRRGQRGEEGRGVRREEG